ncbi:hypothetical protein UY3_05244 [Chelonia mydas]|uniref:Uncharacterized protein n=1 Tax=Chelonia mydas TaxID=8469 RepID=M7BP91_CHEMY|nr:hypothetical protein UY3_05244 [Chelonia mydas]
MGVGGWDAGGGSGALEPEAAHLDSAACHYPARARSWSPKPLGQNLLLHHSRAEAQSLSPTAPGKVSPKGGRAQLLLAAPEINTKEGHPGATGRGQYFAPSPGGCDHKKNPWWPHEATVAAFEKRYANTICIGAYRNNGQTQ